MDEDDISQFSSEHLDSATLFYDHGNLFEARNHYGKAYGFDPEKTMNAIADHAKTYLAERNYELAIPLLETALAFDPHATGDPLWYFILGVAYAETGESVEKISELFFNGIANGLDPIKMLEKEAAVYIEMGELEEALDTYGSLSESIECPEYMERRATLLLGLSSQPLQQQGLDY